VLTGGTRRLADVAASLLDDEPALVGNTLTSPVT
jgi:hypothetical protein